MTSLACVQQTGRSDFQDRRQSERQTWTVTEANRKNRALQLGKFAAS